MLVIAQLDVDKLKLLAETAYPEECCAILLGTRVAETSHVASVVPARNQHANPRRAYQMDAAALITAQRMARENGLAVLGFVHSHPDHDAMPSSTDLEEALWLDHVYGIVSVRAGKFSSMSFYRLCGSSLEDRKFLPEGVKIA